VYEPVIEALKKKILDEGHNTPHSVDPGGNKLYKNLKQTFWCCNTKQEVATYMAKCLTCQKGEDRTSTTSRTLTTFGSPRVEVDSVSMDFMEGLPLTQWKNNVIWVIMDRLTKTAHFIAMRNT